MTLLGAHLSILIPAHLCHVTKHTSNFTEMAASRSVALRRCLTPHWRGVRGMVASRSFFGGSGNRPKESQSKVLSGDEGPFFSLDSM